MSSRRAASNPSRAKSDSAASSSLPRVASVRACCREAGARSGLREIAGTRVRVARCMYFLRRAAFTGYIHACILFQVASERQPEFMAAAAAVIDHASWRPRHNPWVVAFTVTLATFMEVLDTSIANVALPHIAGTFGASANESTWVLTSYLVSNGIVLPVSAWLATRVGRKRYYMFCVVLFAGSSFLCGLAPTLGMLVFFRVLQGVGGGGLQPSEQAILADSFSPEQRGMAFSIYAMAVVFAPAIGPTVGGWITDNYSWRWIFYINIPISIISLILTYRIVEDPPYLAEEREKAKKGGIDYIGLGLVALGIGCLQMVMDKGQELDWFGSRLITVGSIIAVSILIC